MIKIIFNEPKNKDWKKWRQDCKRKTTSTIKAASKSKSISFNDLYKRQKKVYLDLDGPFRYKCAYCETSMVGQHGDLDHFRPKGKVTDSNNKEITFKDSNGKRKPHPGYYWLAYYWLNLLPSCIKCNRPSSREPGETIGKWNQFPVKRYRATKPGNESLEIPLLIHPVLENPSLHLDIDSTGLLIPLSEMGVHTINVFGLNKRESLIEDRKDAYQDAQDKLDTLMGLLGKSSPEEASRLEYLVAVSQGEKPYSIAALKGLSDKKPQYVNVLTTLNLI